MALGKAWLSLRNSGNGKFFGMGQTDNAIRGAFRSPYVHLVTIREI
jgi:hypothetical protein